MIIVTTIPSSFPALSEANVRFCELLIRYSQSRGKGGHATYVSYQDSDIQEILYEDTSTFTRKAFFPLSDGLIGQIRIRVS